MFFTLPRKSKSNKDKHSISIQDRPTSSEMEQLSALLKDFDANDHPENRRVSRELNPRSVPHKSEPDLAKFDSNRVSADSGHQMQEKNYSVHKSMSQVSHPFFTGSEIIPKDSETDSPKIRKKYSEGPSKGSADIVLTVSPKSVRSEVVPVVNWSEISYSTKLNGSHSNYELASKSSRSPPLVNGESPRGGKDGPNEKKEYQNIEILSRSPKVWRSTPEHHVDPVGKSARSPESKRMDDRNVNAAKNDRNTTSPKVQRSRTEKIVDSRDFMSWSPKSVHTNDLDVTEDETSETRAYDRRTYKDFELSSVSPKTHRSRTGKNIEPTEVAIKSLKSIQANDREVREDNVIKAVQKGYPDIETLSKSPKAQRSNAETILEAAQVAMGRPRLGHSDDREVRESKEARAFQKGYPEIRTSSKSPEIHISSVKTRTEVEVASKGPNMSPVNGQVIRESKVASNDIKYRSELDHITKISKIEEGKLHMDQSMIHVASPKHDGNGLMGNEEKSSKTLKGKHKSPEAERRDVGQNSDVGISVTRGVNESVLRVAERERTATSAPSQSHLKDDPSKMTEKPDYKQVTEIPDNKIPDNKPPERKRSIFRVIVPKIMSMERVRSVKKSDTRRKSVEAREAQYAAMLNAASNDKNESDPKKSAQGREPELENRSPEIRPANTQETKTVQPIELRNDNVIRDDTTDNNLKQGDESTKHIITQRENQTDQRREFRNEKNHGLEIADSTKDTNTSDQTLNQIESVTKEITQNRLFGKDGESPSKDDGKTTTRHMNRRYQQLGVLAGPTASVSLGSKTQGGASSQEVVSEAETVKTYRRERSKRTDDPDRRLSIKSNPPERNETRIGEDRNEPRRSSITNSHSSIADRFSVAKNSSKTVAERRREFLAKATSQSQSLDLPKTSKSLESYLDDGLKVHSRDSLPTSTSSGSKRSDVSAENNTNDFVTKSQPSIYSPQHRNSNEPIEPPPRKHPHVYRSSELYKPKSDISTAVTPSPKYESAANRDFESQRSRESQQSNEPVENGPQYGVELPGVPAVQRNAFSRWTNDVDFSKSTRQMCQQCGTVTVEKPRKFCRNCQSDYL